MPGPVSGWLQVLRVEVAFVAPPLVFSHSTVTCWECSSPLSLLPPAPAGQHAALLMLPPQGPREGCQVACLAGGGGLRTDARNPLCLGAWSALEGVTLEEM